MLAGALAWGLLPAVLVEQALVVHVGERPQAQAEHYVAERREVKQDGELGLPDAELAATERLGQGVRDSEEVEVLGTQDGAWCDGDASACVVIEGRFLDFQARYLVVYGSVVLHGDVECAARGQDLLGIGGVEERLVKGGGRQA